MTEGNGAAVRVDARIVVAQAERAQYRQPLRGEGFVQFNHVELLERHAELLQQLLRSRSGPDAHDARLDPGRCHTDDARPAAQPH